MKLLDKMKQGIWNQADRGRKKIMKDERRLPSSRINGRFLFSILFWAGLAGIVFLSFQSWVRTGFLNEKVNGYQAEAKSQIASLNEAGFANSPAGEDYTLRFIQSYVNIPSEEKEREERAKEIQGFLAEGLQVAHLEDLSEFKGKRVLKSASLYDVRDVSEAAASYVYRIDYELFKTDEKKEPSEVKTENAEGDEETVTEEKTSTAEESLGTKEQIIVVRVGTDGHSFNVIEQPHFETLPGATRLTAVTDSTDKSLKNTKVESELKQFATQFFTSYTTNTLDEMAYLMEQPETLQGLYEYRGLEKFVVYDGEQKGQYILKSLVLFEETETGLMTKQPFTLVVSRENNKFYVWDLKHTVGG